MLQDIKMVSGSAHPKPAQIQENVRNSDMFVVQPSCPPVSDGIVELLMTVDALKHASADRITAMLPYLVCPLRGPPSGTNDLQDRSLLFVLQIRSAIQAAKLRFDVRHPANI